MSEATGFHWSGLQELIAALRAMPVELRDEGGGIVDHRAELAYSSIYGGYPRGTGDLREHLSRETIATGPLGIAVRLKNSSPLAIIFEVGTQVRHTHKGWNRGVMPPGRVFVPALVEARRAMYGELKQLLERHGLKVTGDG